jgi:enoyl-CoA hydratase/3-hydroxyacyl-CoA dehydrogenase
LIFIVYIGGKRMLDDINKVSIVGAGLMGHGIAQVFAMNNYNVNLIDISEDILKNALSRIKASLEKFASKGKIPEESINNILNKIDTYVELDDGVKDADLIIEAVPENIDLKLNIFRRVDRASPLESIIVSNTSALPITAMAEATERPERVAGMHWFNPPQIMRLVEVIKSKYTDDEVAETIYKLCTKIGKTPIMVNRDIRGFIANRVYRALRYEAYLMVLRGEYRPIEIDSALRYKFGVPMGVFELADFTNAIEIELMENDRIESLREKYPEWEPHIEYIIYRKHALALAREYKDRGLLGVKSGEGFYKYPEPGKWSRVDIPEDAGKDIDIIDIVSPAINLSTWIVENNISNEDEIDTALKLGFRFPKGIFEYAHEVGIDRVVENLKSKMEKVDEDYRVFYSPTKYLLENI